MNPQNMVICLKEWYCSYTRHTLLYIHSSSGIKADFQSFLELNTLKRPMGWDFTFNISPRGKEIQITSHLLKCKVPSIPGGRSPGEENDKCIMNDGDFRATP